jgi:hypothetical protein
MAVAPGFKEWARKNAPAPSALYMGWPLATWALLKAAYRAGYRRRGSDDTKEAAESKDDCGICASCTGWITGPCRYEKIQDESSK